METNTAEIVKVGKDIIVAIRFPTEAGVTCTLLMMGMRILSMIYDAWADWYYWIKREPVDYDWYKKQQNENK